MLQVIGTKSDKETRKAERYLKERRIQYQFVDLKERDLSEKEWKSIFDSTKEKEELLDKSSQFWKKNGYEWREYNVEDELKEHKELLKLPVLRLSDKAHVGWDENWISERV